MGLVKVVVGHHQHGRWSVASCSVPTSTGVMECLLGVPGPGWLRKLLQYCSLMTVISCIWLSVV
eukprot:scaffold190625_cov17-Cyclotella_meneghiniana.AAC.1